MVSQLVDSFGWTERIGENFPGVMKHGVAYTAANVDKGWIATDVDLGLSAQIPGAVASLNDADAAGIAEVRYGAGKDVAASSSCSPSAPVSAVRSSSTGARPQHGVRSHPGRRRGRREARLGARAGTGGLSYADGAPGSTAICTCSKGLWPDLIIVGGGVSKKADKWVPLLTTRTPVVAAQLQNDAGIVGAALAAQSTSSTDRRRVAAAAETSGARTRRAARLAPVRPLGARHPDVGGGFPPDVVTMREPQPAALQPGGIPRPSAVERRPGKPGSPSCRGEGPEPLPADQTVPGERTQYGKEPECPPTSQHRKQPPRAPARRPPPVPGPPGPPPPPPRRPDRSPPMGTGRGPPAARKKAPAKSTRRQGHRTKPTIAPRPAPVRAPF